MKPKQPKIEFIAEVYKVQTLVDLGIRLTLDLPESAIPQAAMLMECKREGLPLKFEAMIDNDKPDNWRKTGKG